MTKKELIKEKVGIGQQHNSFKIITKKEILENTLHTVKEMESKYFDLVWYARSSPQNDHIEGVLENRKRIEESYPTEVNHLIHGEGDWEHGFNSGMLAGMRYVMEAMTYGVQSADESFPFLDT
jgi:hypothetical protein